MLNNNELNPNAKFPTPDVLSNAASLPIATLVPPIVFDFKALSPIATLFATSRSICSQSITTKSRVTRYRTTPKVSYVSSAYQ
jgi:hypothetical protein